MIDVSKIYEEIHNQTYYETIGYDKQEFPNAEAYYSEAISIPMFATFTESEQQFVIDTIKKPLGHQNLF